MKRDVIEKLTVLEMLEELEDYLSDSSYENQPEECKENTAWSLGYRQGQIMRALGRIRTWKEVYKVNRESVNDFKDNPKTII